VAVDAYMRVDELCLGSHIVAKLGSFVQNENLGNARICELFFEVFPFLLCSCAKYTVKRSRLAWQSGQQ